MNEGTWLMNRITKEMLHEIPTTLLYSLEGIQMEGLKWEKILRMQCDDGSFLSSPSSTAFALMRTSDRKCLDFLNHVTRRFNGGGKSYQLSFQSAYIKSFNIYCHCDWEIYVKEISGCLLLLFFVSKCSTSFVPDGGVWKSLCHWSSTEARDLEILQGKARRTLGLCLEVVKNGNFTTVRW